MSSEMFGASDFLLLDKLPILVKETGLSIYDFRFRDLLMVRLYREHGDTL